MIVKQYNLKFFNLCVLCLGALMSGCGGQAVKTSEPFQNIPQSIAYINFLMPSQIEWVNYVNNRNEAGAIVAEWGMKNYSKSDTPIRIIYNRAVPTGVPVNLLNDLIIPLKKSCTDIKITALSSSSRYSTQSGAEVICARLGSNNFGILANLYVFADKEAMHLVASEVKTPPSEKAGILNFSNDSEKQLVQNTQAAISILEQFMGTVKVCAENNRCI